MLFLILVLVLRRAPIDATDNLSHTPSQIQHCFIVIYELYLPQFSILSGELTRGLNLAVLTLTLT